MTSMACIRKIGISLALTLILLVATTGVSAATGGGLSSGGGNSISPKILLPENSFHASLPLSSSGTKTSILIFGSDRTDIINARLQSIEVPVSPESYSTTILPISSQSLFNGNSWKQVFPQSATFGAAASYTPVAPVTVPAGTATSQTGSGLGSLVILGPGGAQGYIINMKSNFYNPQAILGADGLWHNGMGLTPEYWMNLFPPGSYTIQIVDPNTGKSVYCTTVSVVAGQTTTVDPGYTGCPFDGCCSC